MAEDNLIPILELNNVDIYGKRFNGYSLTKYINHHPKTGFSAKLIVNNKLGRDKDVVNLFPKPTIKYEVFDWKIENIERKLKIKNQISVTEKPLTMHPLFKNAKILHFHMYHNMHLPIEFLMRIPKDKQIVIDIHDTFWSTDSDTPMLEFFKHADTINKNSLDAQRRRVLNSADVHLVVHSPFMLNLVQKSSATAGINTTLIDFGINSKVFRPLDSASLRKKYHIPKNDLVLMCRSQVAFKGVSYILSALKKLNLNQPTTILTVGDQGRFDEIKERYNLVELGPINNEKQMAEVFNLCDIFLSPSTEESFGFMAAEAMSCGKPVIVFEGTALPDTVHAPQIGLSTKRSSAALAKVIEELANSPEDRHRRGQMGRDYVLEKYSEKQYYQGYIKLFQKLSRINNRNIIPTPRAHKKINATELFSSLESNTPNQFDFNDPYVQELLLDYNTKLFRNLQKQELQKPSPISLIKKTIPVPIKKLLKRLINH